MQRRFRVGGVVGSAHGFQFIEDRLDLVHGRAVEEPATGRQPYRRAGLAMAHADAVLQFDIDAPPIDSAFERIGQRLAAAFRTGRLVGAEAPVNADHDDCRRRWFWFRHEHNYGRSSGGFEKFPACVRQLADDPVGLDGIGEPGLDPTVFEAAAHSAVAYFLPLIVEQRQLAARLRETARHPANLVFRRLRIPCRLDGSFNDRGGIVVAGRRGHDTVPGWLFARMVQGNMLR